MTRRTSREAYEAIKASGKLGKLQKLVYSAIFSIGPATQGEVSNYLKLSGAWKRFSELNRLGLIAPVGERVCRVSGMNCCEWDTTERGEPLSVPKQLTRKQLEYKIAYLESEVARLRQPQLRLPLS